MGPMIITAGEVKTRKGFKFRRETGLSHWTVSYSFGGTIELHARGRTFRCGPDMLGIMPPGTPYDYVTLKNTEEIWAVWQPRRELIPFLEDDKNPGLPMLIPLLNDPHRPAIRAAMWEFHAWWSGYPRNHELAENALEKVALLANLARSGQSTPMMESRIRSAIQFAAEHQSGVLDVASMAAKASLSPSRFAHLFRESTGMTPMKFLERRRLEHAQHLLLFTRASIKEIAETVGFPNAFHFSTRFHKFSGQSPREYRLNPGQG